MNGLERLVEARLPYLLNRVSRDLLESLAGTSLGYERAVLDDVKVAFEDVGFGGGGGVGVGGELKLM